MRRLDWLRPLALALVGCGGGRLEPIALSPPLLLVAASGRG
jgi:hypothetical protein